jgi:hypothetical protein
MAVLVLLVLPAIDLLVAVAVLVLLVEVELLHLPGTEETERLQAFQEVR